MSMQAIEDWDAWIGACLSAHLKLVDKIGHTDRWEREMTRRETRQDMAGGVSNRAYELRAGLCKYETPDRPCPASRTDAGCAFFHVHWHPGAEPVQHPTGTTWDATLGRFVYTERDEIEEHWEDENMADGGNNYDGDEEELQWPSPSY